MSPHRELAAFRVLPGPFTNNTTTDKDLIMTTHALDDVTTFACLEADPELFFAESPSDVEAAKAVCLGCPVREECLAGALERREPHGVWGGELLVQGVVVARKRPRGRPRKHPRPVPTVASTTVATRVADAA